MSRTENGMDCTAKTIISPQRREERQRLTLVFSSRAWRLRGSTGLFAVNASFSPADLV